MQVPAGIPTVTYCRVQPSGNGFGQGDVVPDGNAVVVLEPGQPSTRFEVSHIIDKSIPDEEACEVTFGSMAGGGLGAVLNPISAFVNDSVNVVIVLVGSKQTKKWSFLKRVLLPFVSNEILANLDMRSREHPQGFYRAQLSFSALDIQDEIITDLIRPANRGLSVATTLEEGINVQGLQREKILDEATLRKLIFDACDNRGVHQLPVGGSIDTSAAVFEFSLIQSETLSGQGMASGNVLQTKDCLSRLLVVDIPSVDPLVVPQNISLLAGPNLFKSLVTFAEVTKKLNNAYRAQLAPFRASKLTHFLSELLGGNALVVAMGFTSNGEPTLSRCTLDMLSSLGAAVHYPLAAREQSEVLQGLLSKYRALLRHAQDIVDDKSSALQEQQQGDAAAQQRIAGLQQEVAQGVLERDKLAELVEILRAKHETIMQEKLKQSEQLNHAEEDNVALAQSIVQLQLAMVQQQEAADNRIHELESQNVAAQTQIETLQEQLQNMTRERDGAEKEIAALQEAAAVQGKELQETVAKLRECESALESSKQRNLDLSAELLTLVNKGEILQAERDAAVGEHQGLQQEVTRLQERLQTYQEENKALLEKLVDKDEELLDLNKKLLKAAAPPVQTAEERERELLEKEMQKEKGTRRVLDAMHHLVEEKKDLAHQRKLQQLETQRQRLSSDLEAVQQDKLRLEDEVQRLVDRQRVLYSQQLIGGGDVTAMVPPSSNGGDAAAADNVAGSVQSQGGGMEDALQELLASYRLRETQLQGTMSSQRRRLESAIAAYRALYDQYRTLIESLEDMQRGLQGPFVKDKDKEKKSKQDRDRDRRDSNASSSTSSLHQAQQSLAQALQQTQQQTQLLLQNTLAEQYSFLSNSLEASAALNSDQIHNSSNSRRGDRLSSDASAEERLLEREKVEEAVAQRTATLLTAYQQRLREAEQRSAHWQRENVALQVQIQQLLSRRPPQLQAGQAVDDDGTEDPSSASSAAAQEQQLKLQLQQQQQQLLQQSAMNASNDKVQGVVEALASEIRDLRRQLLESQQRRKVLENLLPPLSAASADVTSSAANREPSLPLIPLEPSAEEAALKPLTPMPDITSGDSAALLPTQQLKPPPSPALPVSTALVSEPTILRTEAPLVARPPPVSSTVQQLRGQLEAAEKRAALLDAQQTLLEEELRAYKQYMAGIVPQYQRKLMQQQQQLQKQQQQSNALKLPPI